MYITFLSIMAFLTLTSKKLKYLAHPILWNVWALYLLDRENMNNRLGPKEGPMLSS